MSGDSQAVMWFLIAVAAYFLFRKKDRTGKWDDPNT